MPKYNIPVVYSMWGLARIEANSLKEALDIAQGPDAPLPMDPSYIDESYEVDMGTEMLDTFNEGVLTKKDKKFLKENWADYSKE